MKCLSVTVLMTVLAFTSFAQAQAPPTKASISGAVVRATTGEPISRAQITITKVENGRFAQQPAAPLQASKPQLAGIPAVTTDDRGRFQLKEIDPGDYRIAAARNGFIKQEYGQRTLGRPGSTLTVRPGEQVQDITLRLPSAPTISGRVVDAGTGEPLPGITVQALRSVYDAAGKQTLQAAASDRTNDLGEYRLYWINPGRYVVSANPARSGLDALTSMTSQAALQAPTPADSQAAAQAMSMFGPPRTANEIVDSEYPLTYYPAAADISRADIVVLQPGTEIRADFNLARGVRYRIRGRVLDGSTGKPPSDAAVFVSSRTQGSSSFDSIMGGFNGMLQNNAYNPDTGEFELRNVAPGSYWLQAMIEPQTPPPAGLGAAIPTNPADLMAFLPPTAQIPVDVFGQDLENVALVVSAGVSVSGRVRIDALTNADANALGSVALSFQPVAGGATLLSILSGNVRPGPDGAFTIPHVAPGEYRLSVSGLNPTAYVKEARLDQYDVLAGVTISGRVDGSLEIVLSGNAGQIDGSVVGADLKPVSSIQAVLIPMARNRTDLYKSAFTDKDGRFTIRGIPPGDYRLFSWEDIEPFAYYDPEVVKQYETQGKLVRIHESAKETIEVRMIPAQ